jgi:hypothetical protein
MRLVKPAHVSCCPAPDKATGVPRRLAAVSACTDRAYGLASAGIGRGRHAFLHDSLQRARKPFCAAPAPFHPFRPEAGAAQRPQTPAGSCSRPRGRASGAAAACIAGTDAGDQTPEIGRGEVRPGTLDPQVSRALPQENASAGRRRQNWCNADFRRSATSTPRLRRGTVIRGRRPRDLRGAGFVAPTTSIAPCPSFTDFLSFSPVTEGADRGDVHGGWAPAHSGPPGAGEQM